MMAARRDVRRRALSAALLLGLVLLVAAHGLILRGVAVHSGFPGAAIAVLVLAVVVKHLGLLGSAWAALRRVLRRRAE